MKYRKRPIVIEAEQFDGVATTDYLRAIVCFCMKQPGVTQGHAHIHTWEGVMLVRKGDYVVRGIKGECYPVNEAIFEATYEVEE